MKFRIGDYVRFINERQEGIVTRIIDQQLVGVTVENDFELPVLASEIVLVDEREGVLTGEEPEDFISRPAPVFSDTGIYLSFKENPAIKSVMDIRLINNTDYELLLSFVTESGKHHTGIFSGQITRKSLVKISSVPKNDLGNWPVFHFQLIYHFNGTFAPRQPLIGSLKIQPSGWDKHYHDSPLTGEPSYIYQIDGEKLTIDPASLKESFFKSSAPQKDVFTPAEEVDLHIEELTPDFAKMSGGDILNFQLEHFRRCLESAIAHRFERIIFIHGVGNGILRHEIHKRLGRYPEIKTFKDARKEKFGYGATEVILK